MLDIKVKNQEIKETEKPADSDLVSQMFDVGAHYGYSKSKKHPSSTKYIFGLKNKVEIFDLEKTAEELKKAEDFVQSIVKDGKKILFVGTKNELRNIIKESAESISQPYVINRWIGGTITNFPEVKKRIDKLIKYKNKIEKGEFAKHTKKERLLIDREVKRLEDRFGGIVSMEKIPDALFIVDVKNEKTAVLEAKNRNIPIISLSSSDCNFDEIDYPIPANDTAIASVKFFMNKIIGAINLSTKALTKEDK